MKILYITNYVCRVWNVRCVRKGILRNFNFMTTFKETMKMRELIGLFHLLHNAYYKISPYLSSIYTLDHNRYITNGEVQYFVFLSGCFCSDRRLSLRHHLAPHREPELECVDRLYQKFQISYLTKTSPVVVAAFHAEGQTDRHDESSSRFLKMLCKCP